MFWNAGLVRGPICDAVVVAILKDHAAGGIPVTRALVDDDEQHPDGAAWAHIEDMARRGLVVIENNTARLA